MTYKSGNRTTQIDYILCRRGKLKEVSDCKVVAGESVAKQHRLLVCRMTILVKKRKKEKLAQRTKWWKLRNEEYCMAFRKELKQCLGGQETLPDDWITTSNLIRETSKKVLGVSSGRKIDKETWWWNEEVQKCVQQKKLAKKKWDIERTEESKQKYRRCSVKQRLQWQWPNKGHLITCMPAGQ